jgi:hypothetical protein
MAPSEKEKMLAGELYRSTDSKLQIALAQAQQHLRQLNAIPNEATQQPQVCKSHNVRSRPASDSSKVQIIAVEVAGPCLNRPQIFARNSPFCTKFILI